MEITVKIQSPFFNPKCYSVVLAATVRTHLICNSTLVRTNSPRGSTFNRYYNSPRGSTFNRYYR